MKKLKTNEFEEEEEELVGGGKCFSRVSRGLIPRENWARNNKYGGRGAKISGAVIMVFVS